MWSKLDRRRLRSIVAALGAAGLLFGATCTSAQIEAVAIGVQAVADELDHPDDRISFGDWLADELENL